MPTRNLALGIILTILLAIILVVTFYLAYVFFTRREVPPGTYEVEVGDQTVLVESDPELAIRLVSTPTVPPPTAIPATEMPLLPEASDTPTTGTGPESPVPPTATPVPIMTLPAPLPTAPPPTRANQVYFENYQVSPPDTLYSISRRFNTTIPLMARYGISAEDIIPGTFISVPVANPAYCPGSFPYVVAEGDTLYRISVKRNTTIATLKQLNGLGDNFRLDLTSVICVPNPP